MKTCFLVALYLVGGVAWASAGELKLSFTHPDTNSDGTPLTDLRGEQVWLRRVCGDSLYIGEIPGAGREGKRDSFIAQIANDVHYVSAYMYAVDFTANRGERSNYWLAAVPAAPEVNLAPGLQATYFDNKDLQAPLYASRVDSAIVYDWDYAAPMPGMGVDTFSIRWEGYITATTPGLYAFRAQVEDGFKAWIGDVLGTPACSDWLVNNEHAKSFQMQLAGGSATPFRFEYFANNGTAAMRLFWTPPGGTEQLVPASAFSHIAAGSMGATF